MVVVEALNEWILEIKDRATDWLAKSLRLLNLSLFQRRRMPGNTAYHFLSEGTELPTVKQLNEERSQLIKKRQAEYAEYRKMKAERVEFIRAKKNADVILNRQEIERIEHTRIK